MSMRINNIKNIRDITAEDVGKTFYIAYTGIGKIVATTVIGLSEDGKTVHFKNENGKEYRCQAGCYNYDMFISKLWAGVELKTEHNRILREMSTPEKALQYVADKSITPFVYDLGYYDIVGDRGLTPLEWAVFRNIMRENFSINLKDIEEETE